MNQRTFTPSEITNLHCAVIMDGNGRWATKRGLPRVHGHRAGAEAVRRAVEAAPECGIATLTLYAFSSDNWNRPPLEVAALMRLFLDYLRTEAKTCAEKGIRLSVIGRRDRLAPKLLREIEAAEQHTRSGERLHVRIAVDYSSRDQILRALHRVQESSPTSLEAFSAVLGGGVPDVDLLIRTSGEQRLSDFLLWESAYAELFFTPTLWPDFARADLEAAVAGFRARDRRFGRITETLAS